MRLALKFFGRKRIPAIFCFRLRAGNEETPASAGHPFRLGGGFASGRCSTRSCCEAILMSGATLSNSPGACQAERPGVASPGRPWVGVYAVEVVETVAWFRLA